MRKAILGTLIAIVVIGGTLTIERSLRINRPIPSDSDQEEKILPSNVTLREIGSNAEKPLGKFTGKVVILNFWATWCEACIAEMPSLGKLYEMLKNDGLEIIAINVDENPEQAVPKFLSNMSLKFPVYVDPTGELVKTFNVVAIPYSVVTNRNLKVIWAESGERDWASDQVITEIRKLLKES